MSEQSITNFSMLDPRVSSDPYEFYALLQKECPVYEMPETGTFVITKYDDLRQVLKDFESFTSDVRIAARGPQANLQQSLLTEGGGWEHVPTLQRTDPPVHARYRKLVDRVFTIKRVREMTPHLDKVVNDLIDGFINTGECEFNDNFAMRMPRYHYCRAVGLES